MPQEYKNRYGVWPTGYAYNASNKQYFDDVSSNTSLISPGSEFFVVGAGARTGFKSYDAYDWLRKKNTKAFIYLGFLKNE